jgi:ATP-binding cassette, subfamily B, bacterial
MKILLRYLRAYSSIIAFALLLAAINQVFSLFDPYIIGRIMDKFLIHHSDYQFNDYMRGVGLLLLAGVGVAFVSRVAKNFQDYYVNVVTQRAGAKIYTDGIRHSLMLPYQVFEDQRSGQTLSVLQKARDDSQNFISAFVNIFFTSLVGLVFVAIYSINVSWIVTVLYVSVAPLLGFVVSLLSKKVKKIQKVILAETTGLAGSTTESLRNIELVKSLGLTKQEVTRLNNTTERILQLELKKVRYIRSISFVQGTMVNFLRACIMLTMTVLVFKNVITPGQYTSLMIYSFFIFSPLQEIGNVINIYREAEVSLKNFENITSTPIEAVPVKPVHLNRIQKLDFEHVSFRHQSSSQNAVSDVSFNVETGDTIAFVGPSGAGKSTLVKLLVGLYHPREGEIAYNGTSFKNINLDELREQIGFVTQDTQLFSGTIKENLLFVNPTATDEEIMDVLQKAACQNLLARADKGIETVIGEGGVKVSGGEKQRLSIARALLRKPSLLVFDEATSSLDSLTEEEITQTIRNISAFQQHITILIAHRLSTIMHADCIFVLEHGKIIEKGMHDELLQEKGLYYAMWRQQAGERKYLPKTAALS